MKPFWVIGVSGGVDSIVLLHQLLQQKRNLVVVHVNYKQRISADRDQEIVEAICQKNHVPLVVFDGSLLPAGNFQDTARKFRYQAFQVVYEAYQASRLVLAHHLDDQYETILFQLMTHRTPKYLGMKRFNKIMNMVVFRPLLKVTKDEILKYAHHHQLRYGIDESNLDLKYTRNQIRQALQKLSLKDKELLLTYQEVYEKRRKKQQYRIHQFLKTYNQSIPMESYQKLEDFTRWLLLRTWLQDYVEIHELSFRFFKDLDAKLLQSERFDQVLNDEWIIRLEYGSASIVSRQETSYHYTFNYIEFLETPYFKLQPSGKTIEGITLSKQDFPITIRSPLPTDAIKMSFGTKKVNRFLIDRKVHKQDRKTWPVVINAKQEVIFVSGLGCDVNHYSTNPTVYVVK